MMAPHLPELRDGAALERLDSGVRSALGAADRGAVLAYAVIERPWTDA